MNNLWEENSLNGYITHRKDNSKYRKSVNENHHRVTNHWNARNHTNKNRHGIDIHSRGTELL